MRMFERLEMQLKKSISVRGRKETDHTWLEYSNEWPERESSSNTRREGKKGTEDDGGGDGDDGEE